MSPVVRTCPLDGCTRPSKSRGTDLCSAHYRRELASRADRPRCEVDGCGRSAYARGLCNMHSQRLRKTGTTEARRVLTADERFDSYVDLLGPVARNRPDLGRCHVWTGALRKGYGAFSPTGKSGSIMPAHRFAYERALGPVPIRDSGHRAGEPMALDHFACDNPPCVNPLHLTPATDRDNVLRSRTAPSAVNARKTHCNHGHEFTEENTYRYRNQRFCRECHRQREIARRRAA